MSFQRERRMQVYLLSLLTPLVGSGAALAQDEQPLLPTVEQRAEEGLRTQRERDGETLAEQKLETMRQALPGREANDPFVAVDDPMLEPVPPPKNILPNWQSALNAVRQQNPDLRRAYAQVEAARGQASQALSGALPQLTGTANLNYHILKGEGPRLPDFQLGPLPSPNLTFTAGASLSIPLLRAQTWYDYKTSKRVIQQAEYSSEDAERLIVGSLAEALVAVVTAERLAEVTRLNLLAALSNLELNKRRARLGSANAVDLLRSEQEVADSRSQVVDADEALRRSREALGLALGESEPWGVTPTISLDQLRSDARSTCQQGESIEGRPDILAAKESVQVANRQTQSVGYGYLPEVRAQTGVNYSTNELQMANRENVTWTIGGVLSWNFYDGGLRSAQKRSNKAAEVSAEQDLQSARINAEVEVRRAFRGVKVAAASLQIAQKKREVAFDTARLARVRFVNGTGSSFDMVDTQSRARQSELDVTVKEFELLRAEIAAYLALASCDI
ncbi:MAG: TolC family protein [Polyangiaceae bacterium]|nr:TolC family protein [Polyangiaceae bacterium]